MCEREESKMTSRRDGLTDRGQAKAEHKFGFGHLEF